MSTVEVGSDGKAVLAPSLERVQALREAGISPCVQALLSLDGELRIGALRRAVAQVVARHAILQRLGWTMSDLTAIPVATRRSVRERRLNDERRALADSARAGTLVRAHLSSWSRSSHDLLLTLDARAADAGTLSALSAELMEVYADAPRFDDPLSYADVVGWQLALAQDEGAERGRLYWELHGRWREAGRSQPAGEATPRSRSSASAVAATATTGARRSSESGGASGFVTVERSEAVCAMADRAASEIGCSVPSFLLACWQALFWRLDRLVPLTGVTVAARKYPELAEVVGPLDCTLPLDSRSRDDMTVAAFVRAVDRAWQGVVEWQEYYDWRKDGVPPDHVYDLGFAHVAWPGGWTLGGLRAKLACPHVDLTGARLTLTFCSMGGDRVLCLQFDPRTHSRAAVRRFSQMWSAVVEGAAARPGATIDSLPLLTASERAQIVRTWNAPAQVWRAAETPAPVAAESLPRMIEARAAQTPDAVAICSAGATATYASLNDEANRIARWVRSHGLGAEDVVGVSVGRKPALVAAVLGILKSGAAYLPLDASYPDDRLRLMAVDAKIRALVTERDGALALRPLVPLVYEVDGESATGMTDVTDMTGTTGTTGNLEETPQPDQAAYVIYTSGSTGSPKGVVIAHRNLTRLCEALDEVVACTATDTVAALTTLSFDISVLELLYPLARGARVLLLEDRSKWTGVTSLFTLAHHYSPTVLQCTPTLARLLTDDEEVAPMLRGLRLWLVGGEALPAALAVTLRQRCGGRVLNMYGPTETTVWSLTHEVTTASASESVPIGRPLLDNQVYVRDHGGELVPIGLVGELSLGGAQVARGYWGRPDLTADRFVPDPFSDMPGSRMYRTGDLARWSADGQLAFIGRVDTQVKLRGFRVELGEVETALRRDARVQDAVVTLHGAGDDRRLVGYVIPQGDEAERAGMQRTQIETWQPLWETTYESNAASGDFDLAGWISSYTGEAIPTAEMRIWVEETVERLRALAPQAALEVGCGTGLLLTRVAPGCARYIGIDFAQAVLTQLGSYVAQRSDLQHVELRRGLAHELEFLPDDSVELVILNSVAQYFPDVDYLLNVLAEAVRVTRPGGHVFVGDVRSLPLLQAYHTSVQLDRAPDDITVQELRDRSRRACRAEDELVLDAGLFEDVARRWPKVGRVEVALKSGAYDNELSRFRYDVTLQIGAKQTRVLPTQWIPWDERGQWRTQVEQRLAAQPGLTLGLRGMRDQRAAAAVDAERLLQTAASEMTIRQMRSAWAPPAAEDPDAVLQWARRQHVTLGWTRFTADGLYDVVINPQWTARSGERTGEDARLGAASYRRYGNAPARIGNEAALVLALQQALRRNLPDYMVPAHIVVLDAFPLLPSGKIDRRRLPAPDAARMLTREYVAPRTPPEEIVVGVWQEVLHLPRVGVYDNFLAIGGDSLNAVQVLVRLREAFGRPIALRTLFERATPAALAEELLRPDGGGVDAPPLERVSRDEPLPVSFGQERLWVVDRVTGSEAYRVPMAVEIGGDVDPRALVKAVNALAARHEVLRTTIGVENGRPVQVIAPVGEVPVPWVDLGALMPAQRARASDAVLRTLDLLPFDLQHGPLWRVTMLRLDPQTHIFTCFMHHIVADGWSVGVLLTDLPAFYEAARTGQPARLPELTVQYADYAAWQRRVLAADRRAMELAYWRERLADVATLALPTDRARGPLPGVHGGSVSRQWDAALGRSVHAWARAQGATLFMVLLAGWQALLARHGGQPDVAVGVPVAQRPKPELEPLIGFFLNTLVMRAQVDARASWRTLVSDVRKDALAAYEHQNVPFEQIIEELQPPRDVARTPFFQVMFTFQNNPQAVVSFGDLRLAPVQARDHATKYELALEAAAHPDGVDWLLQYDTSLFDRSTVARLLEHLESLVRAALEAPEAPLGTLSVLSEAERRQIHASGHVALAARAVPPADEWPLDETIVDHFNRAAKRHPARIAVRTRQESWTYRELNRCANSVARALPRAVGGGEGGRVALLCSHDATMVAAILGVLKAGHAYVPLDPRAPVARLHQIRADAEPCALVTDAAHAALARDIAADAPIVVVDALERVGTARKSPRAPKPPLTAGSPAYVLYTSGSTGEPKGVVQSQRNVRYFIRAYSTNLRLLPTDRLTLLPAYGFDASVMDIFGALLNGAALYPFSMREATPEELADWIDAERITVLHATPTVFRTLMNSLSHERVMASVRLVVLGGEAAWRTDAEQFARHFPPTCVLVNGLGPTESTVTLQSFITSEERLTRNALSIGHPVDGTNVRLIDDHGYDAEVFGEIVVESPHVAVGYWRRDDLTQAAFEAVDDVEADSGRRRYRTGDLARRLPDGSLEFLGRKDRQVKIRGYRIELGEVETALDGHPGVRDCVASIVSDARGTPRLVAYFVPRDAEAPPSRELRQFVAARLPDPMVPSLFVPLEALPFRANGKVDRDALPPPQFELSSAQYVAPRDFAEQQMADLWREVLGVDRVGVEDNFFELGGDSIKAIQITARVRTVGISMTPWLMFQYQTIADLVPALASMPADLEPADAVEAPGASIELTEDQIAQLASRVEFETS